MKRTVTVAHTVSGRPVECSLDRLAVIVVDMQRDFLDTDAFYVRTMDEKQGGCIRACVPNVVRLAGASRTAGVQVVLTREGHNRDLSDLDASKRFRYDEAGTGIGGDTDLGRLLIKGEPGHAFIEEIAAHESDIVIDKAGQDAFLGTSLEDDLAARGITHVAICGVTAGTCVQSTLRGASDRGLYAVMVADAVGAFREEDRRRAVDMVDSENGAVGFLTSTEAYCEAIR